ncbi:DnaJ-domain-containing protein [Aaosphaeria arxii CBS 175.79]|uniref:DnaJ-domain-containing protein n=1 Tax=Aaosphaeria arxii CBS 175.79 TaxID=1450172 RepID=A0A6A5Y6B3_9PLEO|nr:DnaJ-domain-containing protein [Aaosphaeria arxii CBS 175.79]KAF2021058.1 DnaJ-domain-containing protein [Aaosphaeria arxii CBS 175.79]
MVARKNKDEYDDDLDDEEVEDGLGDAPPSVDPYEVLQLEKEATADDVKKAYRKLALKHHPDKAPESEKTAANKKFQEIAFAYAVLSDERRRKRYDLTGSTAESLEDDEDFDWLSFYREQFDDVVSQQNIQRISDEYKGSAQEREDILNAYCKFKGNLDSIYDVVMLSDILEDDDRFRGIIDEEIEKGTIESFPRYAKLTDSDRAKAKTKERKRREDFDVQHGKDAADKAKAKQRSKKNNTSDLGDLAALIQQRQKSRAGNFFDNLEAKYAPKSRSKKRATPMDEDEPSEEAFQAAQARLKKPKSKAGGKPSRRKVVDEDEEDDLEEEDLEEPELSERSDSPPRKKKRTLRRGKAHS